MDLVALSNGLHGSVQMDSVALFSWIGWLRHHGIFSYQIALKNGQYDRAIFILKQLNELYLDHGLQNKLKKVKELQENFYKMSYANQIIEDIGLKLN